MQKFRRFFIFVLMQKPTTFTKGRSSIHIKNRNAKLAARFYWYSCILELKFSRCLQELELEFDITESTICDLISANSDLIASLESNAVSVQQLKTRFPFLNWSYSYSHATKSPILVQQSLNLF